MPPLLLTLAEKRPPNLHWIGVSYGLTSDLLRFWKRQSFAPVYMRQTANDLTGEHTCIMLRTLDSGIVDTSPEWLGAFVADFKKRFLTLLGVSLRSFSPLLSLTVLEAAQQILTTRTGQLKKVELDACFTAYDLKRLQSYANNMLDYHVIIDLLPQIARHYFQNQLNAYILVESEKKENEEKEKEKQLLSVTLSAIQKAILLGMSLQAKTVDQLSEELNVPVSQLLALFTRLIRKVSGFYDAIQRAAVASGVEWTQPAVEIRDGVKEESVLGKRALDDEEAWDPVTQKLDDELNEAGKESLKVLKEKQRKIIESLDLSEYV